MNEATRQSMGEQELKRDVQYELWCETCKCMTKQARLEGDEFWCTRCSERHLIYTDDWKQMKTAITNMAVAQHNTEKIL